MKKRAKRGFSLLEMMVALAILVFIILGVGVGMDAGIDIYKEAIFEADSASMAGIVNSNLGDILRYSTRVTVNKNDAPLLDANGTKIPVTTLGFVFTSADYGIKDAYFYTPVLEDGTSKGVLRVTNLKKDKDMELVNTGAYPDLYITNFKITYYATGTTSIANGGIGRGGYFEVTYDIFSTKDDTMTRSVSTVVRLMNPPAVDSGN